MNKMKRLTYLALTMMVGVTLAACGSGTTDKEEANKDEKVKLSFGIWDAEQEKGMNALAEEFMKENKNYDIEVQVTPWDEYWTKMEAAATGGQLPDVFWMHTNEFLKYASNDMLIDLTDLEGTEKYEMFPDKLMSLASFDDKVFGVPKDYDTIALAYNKDLFDAANLEYPDDTWTWETLKENANKLTDTEKGVYGFAVTVEDQEGYLPPIYQAGGYVLKDGKSVYTDAKTRKGIQNFADLALKEKVSPTLAQLADTNQEAMFQSGKLAMAFMGSWRMSTTAKNEDIKDSFDIAVLPEGEVEASVINGLSFAGSNKTEHPEEVKKFLSFLASEKAQNKQAEEGTAISARKGSDKKWIETYPNYNAQAYLDMEPYAVPVSTSLTKAEWVITEKEMMKKMLTGELSVEEGTNAIAKEMDSLLKTEK